MSDIVSKITERATDAVERRAEKGARRAVVPAYVLGGLSVVLSVAALSVAIKARRRK